MLTHKDIVYGDINCGICRPCHDCYKYAREHIADLINKGIDVKKMSKYIKKQKIQNELF